MEVVQSRYDLELSDVNYIIERYQQRAYEVNPLMGAYASFLNVVESSRQVIDIGMDSIRYVDLGIDETLPTGEEGEELVGDIECSTDKDFEQVPISGSNTSGELADLPVSAEAQEVADIDSRSDIEKCIECDERPENAWEISFKPIFAMDGFRDLLNTLSATMNDLLRQLDPFAFVNGLCPFLDSFAERTCTYDMKAILGLINMLIGRYATSALEMTLNWSTLLGPMVKGVAEVATGLIEEIMREVSYLFKCLKEYLFFAKDLINQVQQLITDSANLVDQALIDPVMQMGNPENYRNSSINRLNVNGRENVVGNNVFDSKSNLFFTETGYGNNFMEGGSTYRTGPTYTFPSANFHTTRQTSTSGKKPGIPDGVTGSYNDLSLERMFGVGQNANNMKGFPKGVQATANAVGTLNTELIDRLLAILNSAEQFCKGLLSNLVLSIKSLDSMMSQGFNTTVKLGGIILFLTDAFQLIMSMIEGKFGFQGGICKSLEAGDFKTFEAALKAWFGTDEIFDVTGLENGQVRIDSGIYNIDVRCGWPSEVTEEQRSQNIDLRFSTDGDLNWLSDVFGSDFT